MTLRLSVVVLLAGLAAASTAADARVDRIKQNGVLTCGIDADKRVTGFAERDAQGRYRGLDVDICRALAAALLGASDKVRFVQAASVADFTRTDTIDVVSRRLTWELRREAPLGLLFGPITFYDGQGFLVAKRVNATTSAQLSKVPICVAGGTPFEYNANVFFSDRKLTLKKIVLESADAFDDIARALTSGRCGAYTADISELGAIRLRTMHAAEYMILPERISEEPLAPLVRDTDTQLYDVLRWTVFALIEAERLGVTSANIDTMRRSDRLEIQRLLGVVPGNGKALGLAESWAYNVIKSVGNYGELFERNVGRGSPVGLDRGRNRLWTEGGLLYAPPLR